MDPLLSPATRGWSARLLRAPALALALAVLVTGGAAAQAVYADPAWVRADSAASRVQVTLVAGMTGANGGMNFNGAGNGALTLVVPVRWRVVLHYRNNDQVQPHSVEVIPAVTPVPSAPQRPAFEGAASRQLTQGLPPDGHEDVSFLASRAGSFYLFCAVPGHGMAGMWIRLEVSNTAHAPSLAVASK